MLAEMITLEQKAEIFEVLKKKYLKNGIKKFDLYQARYDKKSTASSGSY